jgi:hypothetical protein
MYKRMTMRLNLVMPKQILQKKKEIAVQNSPIKSMRKKVATVMKRIIKDVVMKITVRVLAAIYR